MLLGEEKLELELQENAPRKCLFHLRGAFTIWNELKGIKDENSQLVSATTQLKFAAKTGLK